MNIIGLVQLFLVLFGYNFNKPKSLHKDTRSRFEKWCNKIAPYIIFFGIIILMITLVLIFVKYGAGLTGTEANVYYNGGLT